MGIITVNLIAEKNGEILIVKRASIQSEAGLWSLPGGTVESGETLREAIRREVKEELGCAIDRTGFKEELELYDVVHSEKVDAYYFKGKIYGEIKLNKQELCDYDWIYWSELPLLAYGQNGLFKN